APLFDLVDGDREGLGHRRALEAHPLRDTMEQVDGHDQVAGEGAVVAPPRRALLGADLRPARTAEVANAARPGMGLAHHTIARLPALDAGPYLGDHPGELVPQDDR